MKPCRVHCAELVREARYPYDAHVVCLTCGRVVWDRWSMPTLGPSVLRALARTGG